MTSSPLKTMSEAGDYLRYRGAHADLSALKFCRRHDVKLVKRGRAWLVRQSDLDAALEQTAVGGTVPRALALLRGVR